MRWYTVNTNTHQEILAEESLQRLGLETFFPLLKQTKLIRRRWQTTIEPLFPGYFFVLFNVDTHYRAVNYARGVRRLVAFGPTPAAVDEAVIESIRSRIQDGCVNVSLPSFRPGQVVRIDNGPLQGLKAIFEQEMNGQQRAVLLLETLSYQARVIVDLERVVNL